jgi:hypothetical protein
VEDVKMTDFDVVLRGDRVINPESGLELDTA